MQIVSEGEVADLLCRELASIQNPNKPTEVKNFNNVAQLVDILLKFLTYDCGEPLVKEVGQKAFRSFSSFAPSRLEVEELVSAVEDLATTFESFLKKIGVVKYRSDKVRLHGDGTRYAGLLHTTLGKLLKGDVAKINKDDTALPNLSAPIVTFSYGQNNIRETIYDLARLERNKVHNAARSSLSDLMSSFRVVGAAYLFAVEENYSLLRNTIDPVFIFLANVKDQFEQWEHRYLELTGEERRVSPLEGWPDLQALEWTDEAEDKPPTDPPWELEDETSSQMFANKEIAVHISILELPSKYKRFWLIGEPGAGKSTTLQRFAWAQASEILAGDYELKPIPVLITANQFDSKRTFPELIAGALKIPLGDVVRLIERNMIWLLFDAFNEIPSTEQESAHRSLLQFLDGYPETPTVLTSRKYGFKNSLGLPVLEILPLSDEMIRSYLYSVLPSEEAAQQLFDQLVNAETNLLEFARNPLLLRMLTRVVKDGKPPANRGRLFQLFMNWIFSRENKKKQVERVIKEECLITIAFKMRQRDRTAEHEKLILRWLREAIIDSGLPVDASSLFVELLDNHILEEDAMSKVGFFHELVLEYFAGLRLLEEFLVDPTRIGPYIQETRWFEPLLMLSGLLESADDLIKQVYNRNVVLAARCIASGAKVSESVTKALTNICARKVTKGRKNRVEATTALLELGTDLALRTLITILGSAREDFPLTEALLRCNRPEHAAIQLLRFGATGRHRTYQCLKVLQGKVISQTVIDSPEVASAQKLLLDGELEARYLNLINSIGVSASIIDWLIPKLSISVPKIPVSSEEWRPSIELLAKTGEHQTVSEVLSQSIDKLDATTAGNDLYSILRTCEILTTTALNANGRELAAVVLKRCLKYGFFGLTAKFMQIFEFQADLFERDIEIATLNIAAERGHIKSLLALSHIFSQMDFTRYLNKAVEYQLARWNIVLILDCYKDIKHVLSDKDYLIHRALLMTGHKMRFEGIRRCIELFNLESYYKNAAKITRLNVGEGYGFMIDLLTNEQLFFNRDALIKVSYWTDVKNGQIVFYSDLMAPRKATDLRRAQTVLAKMDSLEEAHLIDMANAGDINSLSMVARIVAYPSMPELLVIATEKALRDQQPWKIYKHSEQLRQLAQSAPERFTNVLIYVSTKLKTHILIDIIGRLGLCHSFSKLAKIEYYAQQPGYGFATDLETGGKLYFRTYSLIDRVQDEKRLKVGRVFRYVEANPNIPPKYPEAKGISVLESL